MHVLLYVLTALNARGVLGSLLLVVETLAMLVHTWRTRRPEAKRTVLS